MQNPQVSEAGIVWRNELDALQATRADLTKQLEILTSQRGELADQVARTTASLGAAPKARLAEIDARIARLDQEAAKTNSRITELLNHAPAQEYTPAPSLPSIDVFPPPPPFIEVPPSLIHRDVMLKVMAIEGAGFVLLAALLCRWTWMRAKARFAPRNPIENIQLQQAVDAIAIEVERISEGQRFVTTLLNQRHVEQKDARPGVVPPSAPRVKATTPI